MVVWRRDSFHPLRSYSLLSLTVIVLVAAVAGDTLSNFLRNQIIQRDVQVIEELVHAGVQAVTVISGHLPRSHYQWDGEFNRPRRASESFLRLTLSEPLQRDNENLSELFRALAQSQQGLRLNVYGSSGRVLWSTHPGLVGRIFSHNPDLQVALAGGRVARLRSEDSGERSVEGVSSEGYVANYFPLLDPDTSELAGAVEIYRAPDTLLAAVDRARSAAWIGTACVGTACVGTAIYVVLFITVRRASRTIIGQRDALVSQRTFAAIGELTSALVHDIRNPLAAIRSSAELGLVGPGSTERCAALRTTISEVDRLDRWARELLDFVREPTTEVALEPVVLALLKEWEDHAAKANISVRVEVPSDLPNVQLSATAVRQCLQGVLANAFDAVGADGIVQVEAQRVSDAVEVRVFDSAKGLEQCDVEALFHPQRSGKSFGLGIGLTLTRCILRRCGGEIGLQSNAKGTAVALKFPLP